MASNNDDLKKYINSEDKSKNNKSTDINEIIFESELDKENEAESIDSDITISEPELDKENEIENNDYMFEDDSESKSTDYDIHNKETRNNSNNSINNTSSKKTVAQYCDNIIMLLTQNARGNSTWMTPMLGSNFIESIKSKKPNLQDIKNLLTMIPTEQDLKAQKIQDTGFAAVIKQCLEMIQKALYIEKSVKNNDYNDYINAIVTNLFRGKEINITSLEEIFARDITKITSKKKVFYDENLSDKQILLIDILIAFYNPINKKTISQGSIENLYKFLLPMKADLAPVFNFLKENSYEEYKNKFSNLEYLLTSNGSSSNRINKYSTITGLDVRNSIKNHFNKSTSLDKNKKNINSSNRSHKDNGQLSSLSLSSSSHSQTIASMTARRNAYLQEFLSKDEFYDDPKYNDEKQKVFNRAEHSRFLQNQIELHPFLKNKIIDPTKIFFSGELQGLYEKFMTAFNETLKLCKFKFKEKDKQETEEITTKINEIIAIKDEIYNKLFDILYILPKNNLKHISAQNGNNNIMNQSENHKYKIKWLTDAYLNIIYCNQDFISLSVNRIFNQLVQIVGVGDILINKNINDMVNGMINALKTECLTAADFFLEPDNHSSNDDFNRLKRYHHSAGNNEDNFHAEKALLCDLLLYAITKIKNYGDLNVINKKLIPDLGKNIAQINNISDWYKDAFKSARSQVKGDNTAIKYLDTIENELAQQQKHKPSKSAPNNLQKTNTPPLSNNIINPQSKMSSSMPINSSSNSSSHSHSSNSSSNSSSHSHSSHSSNSSNNQDPLLSNNQSSFLSYPMTAINNKVNPTNNKQDNSKINKR